MASRVQVRGCRLQFQERTQLSHVVVYSTSTHHQKALDSLIFQRWHLSWCLPRVRPLSFILRFIRFVFVLLFFYLVSTSVYEMCFIFSCCILTGAHSDIFRTFYFGGCVLTYNPSEFNAGLKRASVEQPSGKEVVMRAELRWGVAEWKQVHGEISGEEQGLEVTSLGTSTKIYIKKDPNHPWNKRWPENNQQSTIATSIPMTLPGCDKCMCVFMEKQRAKQTPNVPNSPTHSLFGLMGRAEWISAHHRCPSALLEDGGEGRRQRARGNWSMVKDATWES